MSVSQKTIHHVLEQLPVTLAPGSDPDDPSAYLVAVDDVTSLPFRLSGLDPTFFKRLSRDFRSLSTYSLNSAPGKRFVLLDELGSLITEIIHQAWASEIVERGGCVLAV